ncbi:jg2592, partial [Pararge aegeria aegeria]
CRHNSKGCCVHCSPLEPWDENYLKEHNIKHLSFHSYLRKMTSGKFVSLDELSFKIKPGCKEHPPWPRGICSACQPGAVTLNRQPFRHVDNVLLEHAAPVDRFLAYWRATGHQRVGFLYGQYEPHPDVPLGNPAKVKRSSLLIKPLPDFY